MCGIAGIACAFGAEADRTVLSAMTDALAHRGPDDRGVAVFDGPDGACCGLGHRRLSIIDLSWRGRQPMGGEDGSVQVVFNGEIYNYRELRSELERLGHEFASRTDTEVIVHAVEEWGERAVRRLDGMFAFAAWDQRTGTLFLARDRFGKKPLHYSEDAAGIQFASELGALLKNPRVSREIDFQSLARFLTYEYVPAPHGILSGCRKVPAGSYLVWQNGTSRVEPYWRPRMGVGAASALNLAQATEQLETLLRHAVAKRLMSDVPLGVFLSGGLDSAAVTAMMVQLRPAGEIDTFAIGFREADFDESPHARVVARYFGTRHHERMLTADDLSAAVPRALDALSEPMADSSIVPTRLLCEFARERVAVALGGDGGDELFAGYDPFLALLPARIAATLPGPVVKAAIRAAALMPASEGNMSFDFRLKQFLKGVHYPRDVRLQAWMASFRKEGLDRILSRDVREHLNGYQPMQDAASEMAGVNFRDEVDRGGYFYQRMYLPGHILAKVDAASMTHSLEARAPFLDTELAEFANALPSRMKLRGMTRKYVLRRMLRGKLSDSILRRGKKGFGIPLAAWLKGPLAPMLDDLLHPDRLAAEGLFNAGEVTRLRAEHDAGHADNRKQLWTLVCFQAWRERFLD